MDPVASEREMVITQVVRKAVDHFCDGEYDRALVCYSFSEVLEDMSDGDYSAASTCLTSDCGCRI